MITDKLTSHPNYTALTLLANKTLSQFNSVSANTKSESLRLLCAAGMTPNNQRPESSHQTAAQR